MITVSGHADRSILQICKTLKEAMALARLWRRDGIMNVRVTDGRQDIGPSRRYAVDYALHTPPQ